MSSSHSSYESTGIRRILALDLGIGSIGIALQTRNGTGKGVEYDFPIVRSCTLPENWASLAEERNRRRMYRTRVAHKAREKWLRRVFEECGLSDAILLGRQISDSPVVQPDGTKRFALKNKGDFRLEREFPPKEGEETHDGAPSDEQGSRTVYCGAALRCLLLLGETAQCQAQDRELEPWQVFKALHSAIQKRGYDPDVPWKRNTRHKGREKVPKPDGQQAETESDEARHHREDEKANRARAAAMENVIEDMAPELPNCQHPCFWEAYRMGLWCPETPKRIRNEIDHRAKSTKWADRSDPAAKKNAISHQMPAVYPRWMVEREFFQLCEAAETLLPQLKGKADYIAYGPTGMPYPNIPRRAPERYEEEQERRRALEALPENLREQFVPGKAREWDAALGQKAPTFDNRCVGNCVLIPRFNVSRMDIKRDRNGNIKAESLLPAELSFLLQLKNFRFVPELPDGRDWLTASEIRKLHADHFRQTVLPRLEAANLKGAITKSVICKWLEENIGEDRTPKPGQENKSNDEIIAKPRLSGRSRYSRPALKILQALLFSGLPPQEFKAALLDESNPEEKIFHGGVTWGKLRKSVKLVASDGTINVAPKKGVTPEDVKFLDHIGNSWERISIRDERLESYTELADATQAEREKAIEALIASEMNPRIRHRLTLLNQILTDDFMTDENRPDRVVIEFAREEFMGKKSNRRKALMDFQKERRDERLEAREALGPDAREPALQKYRLYQEQGTLCLFCGRSISSPNTEKVINGDLTFENAEVAHIVAESNGGPRAYMNLVLACNACNRSQGTLYHADAFSQGRFPRSWDSFVDEVRRCTKMRPFKRKLLTTKNESEAAKMAQNRTALQQTA